MEIIWKLDNGSTVKMYHLCSRYLKRGVFQRDRYYVLPFLPHKFRDRVVFFPRCNGYFKNFDLFANLETSDLIPANIQEEILSTVESYRISFEKRYKKLLSESQKITDKFEKFCNKRFPDLKSISVSINPSFVGVIGDDFIDLKKIEIYPRFDRKISEVFALIVTALDHLDLYNKNILPTLNSEDLSDKDWWFKQIHVKKIFKTKEFKEIFSTVKDITEILYDNTLGNLAELSIDYLDEIGYPLSPYLESISQIENLTYEESILLQMLINEKPHIVTFDQISHELWKDSELSKFSLYAISKLVERLKRKIAKSGIKPNLVHCQRGKGYLLYD